MAEEYDVNADLARGLVCNESAITGMKSNYDRYFSDYPEDCAAIYLNAKALNQQIQNGIYEIWPREGKPFKVLCDMATDGGGWTIFQKRGDFVSQENFYRTWLEYKRGFGDLERQFWLGNDRLSMLTNQDLYQLRIDLEDFDGQERFAQYYSVQVANELDKYRLKLGTYIKGNAGDSLRVHNDMRFSTKDQDNDAHSSRSCAQTLNGAWWYINCHESNLNGAYLRGHHPTISGQGVDWDTFRGDYYSLKTTEMKIRPVWFKP
ncbi:unnamed protein product [Rotaria sordida]|uniref:Fibrinogen C-terminal domain-containing protein n=1 Tax=Rotaria sordida TaxID=392033 RepID=A0A815U0G3_9BILA|nr:unnamed protein product [Rotaria sordida]CAF4188021.1 unnamed protein product [Rotaria sordida]